jgi:hypothetical protein
VCKGPWNWHPHYSMGMRLFLMDRASTRPVTSPQRNRPTSRKSTRPKSNNIKVEACSFLQSCGPNAARGNARAAAKQWDLEKPMSPTLEKVRFKCPVCERPLKAFTSVAGQEKNCPACKKRIVVPTALVKYPLSGATPVYVQQPVARPPVHAQPTVPVEIQMPGELGAFKAQVTQKTANDLTLVATGGGVLAAGVALAFWLLSGGRRMS